jgi:hypothetical protein
MTKRILLIFFVLAAMILPASAANARPRHRKHSVASSRKAKPKSMRKSTRHRSKSRRRKIAKR